MKIAASARWAWPRGPANFRLLYFFFSRCTVCFRSFLLYFFNSRRSVEVRIFFIVEYREVPGASVHSRMMISRLPFPFEAMTDIPSFGSFADERALF